MKITIKRADNSDIPALAALFDAYRCFYEQQSDINAAADFLTQRLAHNQSVVFMAYAAQGQALGFTQLYPIFSSVSMRRTWLLNDLYVDAAARQQGVGAALLDAARQFGITTNAKWLLLQTGEGNASAQSLYEANGWIRETDYFYRMDL
jgi:GNAT superfamily N-acetyltransferase